ncbi:Centrosomal protein of 68 kDa [Triplophysa tibetana]|uniref:Centrosomal protein of 68 kDa n=1 Tax=Triplophysa tibetana TaxID=1572043 RepID=A0A5A9P9U9_9TELE|nr:Centrosomal protein of 68 kDa [Triplophysa tibetana]
MALGVDKALSETSSQMENTSFGRWKLRIPEFIRSGPTESEGSRPASVHKAKDPDKELGGYKKTVTMAPVSREDLDTSMSLSDLRQWSSDEEAIFNTSSNKHSLSSPPSAILSLAVPPVPKLISTPLSMSHSSSYTSSCTRSVKTRAVQMDRGKNTLHNTGPFHYHTKNSPHGHMSPNQANYWACAIPNFMPPSPDRRSPGWDPHKEYEALLDYTYPLRPNMANTWSSPESLLRTDSGLQDSGIELDHFYSSSILSGLDPSLVGTRRGRSSPATGRRSTELQDQSLSKLSRSKSSDGVLSSSLYSPLDQTGLSESQEDWDEEFLRLPERIQELNLLSQQLRDISAQMSKPVTTSWESLGSEVTPVRSPTVQMDKQGGGDEDISEDHLRFEDYSEKSKETAARLQLVSQEVNRSNLREVEAIMDQLSRMSMSDLHIDHQDKKEPKESLMQHIQAFCSNLEKLIQWLYKVVEKVEILSPPAIELDSVKASLAVYKSFQEDVNAHKPLTADVLQTGEMLLHCMNSASPFLEETLALIERQSHTLETHSEYLFSSILSAMDSLTDPRSLDVSAGIS